MSTDAIVLLKNDHKQILRLFTEFEKTSTTSERKGHIAQEVIRLLTVHTFLENEVMYPRIRELVPDLEDEILESYEEHHVADLLMAEIASLGPEHERFQPKMTVLLENVRHHLREEEDEWFPTLRTELTRAQLQQIGAAMEQARQSAPTRSP